jgi:hypothetical protein
MQNFFRISDARCCHDYSNRREICSKDFIFLLRVRLIAFGCSVGDRASSVLASDFIDSLTNHYPEVDQ